MDEKAKICRLITLTLTLFASTTLGKMKMDFFRHFQKIYINKLNVFYGRKWIRTHFVRRMFLPLLDNLLDNLTEF